MKRFKDFRFIIIVVSMMLAMVALMAVTGCTSATDTNEYWKVSEDYINGYGSRVAVVYAMDKAGDLYAVSDATDKSALQTYGKGLDLTSSHSVVGVYLPLQMEKRQAKALLSYGDIAPVVLKKSRDKLYSKEDYGALNLYPVEFTGYSDYKTAMESYDQISDDFSNVENCRIYKVVGDKIDIYSYEKAPDGGMIYNIDNVAPGLYLVNNTYGIVEIK